MAAPNRRELLALVALMLLVPGIALAQKRPDRVPRIGYLAGIPSSTDDGRFEGFRAGLKQLGYAEGRTIVIESRWTGDGPERLKALAAELVALPVDILVTSGTPATRAAQQATTTIGFVEAGG